MGYSHTPEWLKLKTGDTSNAEAVGASGNRVQLWKTEDTVFTEAEPTCTL